MQADDILSYNVKQQPRPAGAVLVVRHRRMVEGPDADRRLQLLSRRCASAARPSPATPRGDAIAEMERLAGQLPRGFGYEWTGQSLQEKLSGSQAPLLLALSALVVFLLLAALYESWTIPLAVLLTVPLGMLGAVLAAMLRGLPNDVYFTVGADHDHRPRRQGRHPDHRIRQGAARAGQAADRGDDRGLPSALPADPDDRPRLRLRRAADGDRHRRRRARASRRSAPA